MLICIDGLDEARNKRAWKDRISETTHWTNQYHRLRFVFSVRSYTLRNTSLNQLQEQENTILKVEQLPWEGDVPLQELVRTYFERYNIRFASIPWIINAFDNALSVKLFSEAHQDEELNTDSMPPRISLVSLIKQKMVRIQEEFVMANNFNWPSSNQTIKQVMLLLLDE